MTESEKITVESVKKKSIADKGSRTEIPAVKLVYEWVGHRRESPEHAERFGDISVLA